MSILYSDFFEEKNIGKLVKHTVKDFGSKGKTLYGRYYGRGYDGNSTIHDNDYHVITFITPHGLLINVEDNFPEANLNYDEIAKVEATEKKIRYPYSPFFTIYTDGTIVKNDDSKLTLKYNHHSNKWFKENGYLTINTELFATNLTNLFSRMLHENYYCNDLLSNVVYNNIDQNTDYSRRFIVISKNKYYNYQFGIGINYPFEKNFKTDTPFSRNPIKLDEDDYLVYFGNTYDKNISLGDIKYGKYIPNNYSPFNNQIYNNEVIHKNSYHYFVEIFIREIVKYKFKYNKTNLNQNDMNIILSQLTIRKNAEIQTLINLLKAIEVTTTNELLKNNEVGKVLKLTKNNK